MLRQAATAAMLTFLLVACGDAMDGSSSDSEAENPTAGLKGPLPGDETTSCVSEYGRKTLVQQRFAFDGVVVKIGESVSDRGDSADLGQPGVTFRVMRWYAGGDGDQVTVDMPGAPSIDGAVAYGIGSRLLVSGQPRWGGTALKYPIAWSCGFTRYHDPTTATEWKSAFSADH